MKTWREIWGSENRINDYKLELLIKANGFDSLNTKFNIDKWRGYSKYLLSRINTKKYLTFYEVGCGSGAFLFDLHLQGKKVSGLDYSPALIKLANSIFGDNVFLNEEAINLPVSEKYDVVMSHSIFFYFNSLEYAEKVVLKMIEKSNGVVAIFDICDFNKKEQYNRYRILLHGKDEYNKKYKDLNHLFFSKEWFERIAKSKGLKINLFDTEFEGYPMAEYKFNVVIYK